MMTEDGLDTWFGLDRGELQPLLRRLRPDADDAHALQELFARAALSGITEPGDRVAGAAVRVIGAAPLLRHLLSPQKAALPDALANPGRISATGPAPAAAAPTDAWSSEEWSAALARWGPRLNARPILRALQTACSVQAQIVMPGDAHWPVGLDDLGDHAPHLLWVRGAPDALPATTERAVAIVGTRAASGYGEYVAAELASGLAGTGITTVSGGAYGIDGVVHRSSLASEVPTVAVLAGGIDRLYPAGHEQLLRRVAEQGVVVAETLPGTSPSRWRFLQRNRVIAALAHTVVVIEAGVRSGALNTTGHAVALGRTVAAVPGPVTSAASAGTHRLIRDFDAALVTSSRDLLALLPGQGGEPPALVAAEPQRSEAQGEALHAGADTEPSADLRVLDALSTRSGRTIEQISTGSGLSLDTVRSLLGLLLLNDTVVETPGGWRKRS